MNKNFFIKIWFVFLIINFSHQIARAQKNDAALVIKFHFTTNEKKLVLGDSNYINAFAESYSISRLKFYISNISLAAKATSDWGNPVFLIDASLNDTIKMQAYPGVYTKLVFSLGVDSLLNCSGAQAGALDPLNGMFWTWNSGYVFFKMEGFSPASTADLHRIEHHIGGYREPYKAERKIVLYLNEPLVINKSSRHTINIQVNLDPYWKGINEIKIADHALVMIPGEQAKKSADNFAAMFSIISIQ